MRRFTAAVVMAMVAGTVQIVGTSPAAALALPPGFRLVDYPTGQAPRNLTNFAWVGDGGLLTGGKDGTVTFTAAGKAPRVLTKVPKVRALHDHGMLGFAPANDYATTGRVYIAYDKGDRKDTGVGMVEEWKASPPDSPTAFRFGRTVLDGAAARPPLAQTTPNHGIDSVVVAPDDTLFVSVGDDARTGGDDGGLRAQNLNQPYGKLLHLTPKGAGVPSNPFFSASAPNSWKSRIYASGLRNPFRFGLDPRSGIPHLGDVGLTKAEEIDTLAPGSNAGWPCYEGKNRSTITFYSGAPVCRALYKAGSALVPTATYEHGNENASVVGGVHYQGTRYPAKYRNSFFYGDYTRGRIWTIATSTTGRLTRGPEGKGFARDAGAPVAFQTGPNGDITYADILTGKVRRLVYAKGNRPPVANFRSTSDAPTRTIKFSAAESYDLDGDALTYRWDFGDGTKAEGRKVVHTYPSAGDSFDVALTVRDRVGATNVVRTTVFPSNFTPVLKFDPPPPRTYAVGDSVDLAASATDAEDLAVGITWTTSLRHCSFPGSCHLHPDGDITGPTYSREFTDHGSDTTMVVTVRVTDSKGASASATYEAKPTLRTLSVTSPVAVQLNGVTVSSLEVVAGSRVQVNAPRTSAYRRFVSWSDGGAAAHALTMPASDLTIVARYRTAIQAKYDAMGGAKSLLGAATSLEYDVRGGRARNYKSGRLFWSAATGAHFTRGPLLAKYLAAGGPAKSCLGFPTTDQYKINGGIRNGFQKGRITYLTKTKKTTLRCS